MQYESTTLHPAAQDLTGQPFNRWTVKHFAGYNHYIPYWTCQCSCGTIKDVPARYLRNHQSKSCGCWRVEQGIHANTTHGQSHTQEWRIWWDMIRRCEDPRIKNYHRYGGRGITVCQAWHDFPTFLADMGPRPSPKHTVERLKNDEGYSPDNCVWATYRTQNRNSSRNHTITYNNKTQCIAEWAEETGISQRKIWKRLNRNWSIEKTLTTP